MVSALQTVAPHVQAGRLRMLGVMSAERAAAFPGVPTLREQGLPDLEVETWYAMFVPAGTPASVVARVNGEINELLKEGDVKDVLARQGLAAAGGRPERLGELVKQELARWTRVVNAAGIKAD
jgi:tripartite-type tricarboxylate transporter receptor subunit TctC